MSFIKKILFLFFHYIKNEWEYKFNLLSKKQRNKTKQSKRLLWEEEKNIKREYGKNRYHNMPEEKKQRLKEYQKNYYNTKIKIWLCIIKKIVF